MKLSILKDEQYNLQELTKNESLSINGGEDFWSDVAREVGQFAANVAETVKDIGDDDEWFG